MKVRVVLAVDTLDGFPMLSTVREDLTIDRDGDFEGNMARSSDKLLDLLESASKEIRSQIQQLRAVAADELPPDTPPPRGGRGHGRRP